MRRLAALVAACFFLLTAPAFAAATQVTVVGGVLQITGDDTPNDVTVTPPVAGDVTVFDTAAGVANLVGCDAPVGNSALCHGVTDHVVADLAGGNDTFRAGTAFPLPVTVNGGAGDDILLGGGNNDTIDGGDGIDLINGDAGDDTLSGGVGADVIGGGPGRDFAQGGDDDDLVSGDAGDDTLEGNDGEDFVSGGDDNDQVDGGDGNDGVSGGEDNDILDGGTGADSIEGDQGIDVVTYARRSEPLTITVGNGLSDDGAAGENDQVGFSVENVIGGSGADVIVGSSLDNSLDGGPGNDQIDGGAGRDTVTGGTGDDQLLLRDGFADNGTCGAGTDAVFADAADQLATDCEGVRLPEPQAPPVEPPAQPGPTEQPTQPTTPPVVAASFARPRATPRVAIRVGPRRDRRAPYSFRLLGRVTPPAGLDPRVACGDVGLLDVQVRRGAAVLLSLRPRLRSDCTFESRVTFKGPRRVRPTRLRFTTSFLGNAFLVPARAKSAIVRVG